MSRILLLFILIVLGFFFLPREAVSEEQDTSEDAESEISSDSLYISVVSLPQRVCEPSDISHYTDDFESTESFHILGGKVDGSRYLELGYQKFIDDNGDIIYSLVIEYSGDNWMMMGGALGQLSEPLVLLIDDRRKSFDLRFTPNRNAHRGGVTERGWFRIYRSDLEEIALADEVRIKVCGSELSLEGTLSEQNSFDLMYFLDQCTPSTLFCGFGSPTVDDLYRLAYRTADSIRLKIEISMTEEFRQVIQTTIEEMIISEGSSTPGLVSIGRRTGSRPRFIASEIGTYLIFVDDEGFIVEVQREFTSQYDEVFEAQLYNFFSGLELGCYPEQWTQLIYAVQFSVLPSDSDVPTVMPDEDFLTPSARRVSVLRTTE